MNVLALQRIDRLIGVPACFLLTQLRRLQDTFFNKPNRPVRSILVVKLAEQGSTVLAYDALNQAAKRVGMEKVYFLAFEENRGIVDVLGIIPPANVLTLSTRSAVRLLFSALRAVIRLRRMRVDAAVDMEFFARGSAILSFLSGAKSRVGFHAFFGAGPYRGDLMTHRLGYNAHIHTSEAFRLLVEALSHDPAGLPAIELPKALRISESRLFSPSAEELARVRSLLGLHGEEAVPPIVLLNPNAGDMLPLRRWPAERYVELAKRLVALAPGLLVVFTGSPSEADAVAQLAAPVGSPRCRCLAGKTTMRELLALYCVSRVLVTNDSGPAHFASLTPIHVLALFGPETPALFAPRNDRTTALWAGLPCSPCVNAYNNRQTPCRNNLCMQAISVDDVYSAVRRALTAVVQRSSSNEPHPLFRQ